MLRYLTAPKIGHLVLLSLYVDSEVPTSSIVPILLILLNPLVRKKSTTKAQLVENLSTSIGVFREPLTSQDSLIPGRTLWDAFLQKIWGVEDFDGLHCLFKQLAGSVAQSREEMIEEAEEGEPRPLSRNSPLGISVRRACLEFTRLQFSDGVALWKELVVWRESTFAEWDKKNPPDQERAGSSGQPVEINKSRSLAIKLYAGLDERVSDPPASSVDDIEKLMSLQVDYMQRQGQRVPRNVQSGITEMLRSNKASSNLLHYSNFLDAWKAADYTSAFDNLHRYFDYSMHVSGRSYYHYALLNMAFLYADFGCFRQAIAAMHESINMARENKDSSCLNFSLSWLFTVSKEYPAEADEVRKTGVLGTDKEALAFIKSKARESRTWSLLSTTLLAEANVSLTNGESLAFIFENISRSVHLNHMKNVGTAVALQLVLEGILYFRLGLSYLQWSVAEIHNQCYSSDPVSFDVVGSACRSALGLTKRGQYSEAIDRLTQVGAEELRVVKRMQTWSATTNFVKLQWAIRRGNHAGVRRYLDQSKANDANQGGLGFAIRFWEIEWEIRCGDTSAAHSKLDALMRKTNAKHSDVYDKLILMVTKARIYDKAGVPHKGFSLALRAASMAQSARVLYVLYWAVGALCRVLICLGEFDAASTLLMTVIPQVLECEECDLVAYTFSVLADAQMGIAGSAAAGSAKRKESMAKALAYLERAFDEYATTQDVSGQCEMMAKRATIMRFNGDLVLANDTAAKALTIREAAMRENEGS